MEASVVDGASSPVTMSAAWANRSPTERLRASAKDLITLMDGWCRPRSIWLRYGLDTLVSSASWRRLSWASWRWLRR